MNYLNQKLQRAMRGGDVGGMQEVASQAAKYGSRDIMRQAERGLRDYTKAQERAQKELVRAQREQERQARQQARDAERAARQQERDLRGDAVAFFTRGTGENRQVIPITAPSGGVMKKWGKSGVLWDSNTGLPYAMDPKTGAVTQIDPDKDGQTVVKDGHVYKVVEGLPWKWVGFDPEKVGNNPALAKELKEKTADAKREADMASDKAAQTRKLVSDNEKAISALEKQQRQSTGEERTRIQGEIDQLNGKNKGLRERLELEQIDAHKKAAYRQQVESANDQRLADDLASRQKLAYQGDPKGGLGLQSALDRISKSQQSASTYNNDPVAALMGAMTDRSISTAQNFVTGTNAMADAMSTALSNSWNAGQKARADARIDAWGRDKSIEQTNALLAKMDASGTYKLTGTNEKGKSTGLLHDPDASPELKAKIQDFVNKTGITEIPRSWFTPEAQEARANANQFGLYDVKLPKNFVLSKGAITTTPDEQASIWGVKMPWNTKGKPIDVGTYQFDRNGVPFIEINADNRLSVSQLSGSPLDGVKEYFPMSEKWAEQFKPRKPSENSLSMLPPAQRREVMDNYKKELATWEQTAKDAYAGQRMDAERLNDTLTRWTVATPEQRQEMIAELDPRQKDVKPADRRLDTRKLFENGMISAQEGRLMERSFYGTDPTMPTVNEAFDEWVKTSTSQAARNLREYQGQVGGFWDDKKIKLEGIAKQEFLPIYRRDNASRVDFNPKGYIAASDDLLNKGVPTLYKLEKGLSDITINAVGSSVGMALNQIPRMLADAVLADGSGKYYSKEEKELFNAQTAASLRGLTQWLQADRGEAVGKLFSKEILSGDTWSELWKGKTLVDLDRKWAALKSDIDNETLTIEKFRAHETAILDATLKANARTRAAGDSVSDIGEKIGLLLDDGRGWITKEELSLSSTQTAMGANIQAYMETFDPVFYEMAKNASVNTKAEQMLQQRVSDYITMNGTLTENSSFGPLRMAIRGGAIAPATETLIEAATAGVGAVLGKIVTGGKYLTTATRAGSTLNTMGRVVSALDNLPDKIFNLGKIEAPLGTALTSGQKTWNKAVDFGKVFSVVGTGEAFQEGIAALSQVNADFVDVAKEAAFGAIGGVGMSAVHMGIGKTWNAAEQVARDIAEDRWTKAFVADYNSKNPPNRVTYDQVKLAQGYQNPITVANLKDEYANNIRAIKQTEQQIRDISSKPAGSGKTKDGSPVYTPNEERVALFQKLNDLNERNAVLGLQMIGIRENSLSAAREINALPTGQREVVDAALRAANGVPLSVSQESTLLGHQTASGKPAAYTYGDDIVLTDEFREEIKQVAPETAKAPVLRKTQAERDAELRAKYGGVFRDQGGKQVFVPDKKPATPTTPAPAGNLQVSNRTRYEELKRKAEGTPERQIVLPDGSQSTSPARPPQPLTLAEQQEFNQLQAQLEPATPTTPTVPVQPTTQATTPATPSPATAASNQQTQPLTFTDIQFTNSPEFNPDTGQTTRSSGTAQVVSMADRQIVLVNVNGVPIPFYLSTGKAGKKNVAAGKWYPILGLDVDGWINKGSQQEISSYYGSPLLQSIAERLDNELGTTAPARKVSSKSIVDSINQGLASIGITPVSNGTSTTKSAIADNIAKLVAFADSPTTQQQQSTITTPQTPAPIPVTPPVTQNFQTPDGAQVTGTFEKQPDGTWQQTSPEAPSFTVTQENTQFFQTLEDKAAYALNPQTPDAVQPGEFGQPGYTATDPAPQNPASTAQGTAQTETTTEAAPPPLPEADVFTQPVNRGTALLMLQTAAPWVSGAPIIVRSQRFFQTQDGRVVDASTYATLSKQERAEFSPVGGAMFVHQGKVHIDETGLVEYLANTTPEARQEKLKAALREELIHVATLEVRDRKQLSKDWSSLPDEAKRRVIETYYTEELRQAGGDWTKVKVPGWQAAAEFWRMYMNAVTEGRTTEQVDIASEVASLAETNPSFAQRIKEALQDIARWLREELLGQLDPDTRAEFEQTAAKIDAEVAKLDAMLGITPQAATPAAEAASPMEAPVEQANAPPSGTASQGVSYSATEGARLGYKNFQYRALDANGNLFDAEIWAADSDTAFNHLQSRNDIQFRDLREIKARTKPTNSASSNLTSQEQAEIDAAISGWDRSNRNRQGSEWMDGAYSPEAQSGFSDAAQNGAANLQSHGMGKAGTLSGGLQSLLDILANGIDPNRGRGGLDTAQLALNKGQVGAQGATASGTSYRDGPFIIVQNAEGSKIGAGITDASQIAAVLVNEANIGQLEAIQKAIQAIRPDIIVAPYSQAGAVAAQLTGSQSVSSTNTASASPAETIDTPAAPLTRLPEKAAPRNQAFVPKPARGAQKWTQEALNTSLTSAAGSFGYKIVDTGIPSQYTAYGETLNYGTALYDKLNPGNEIGQWIDAMNAGTNPAGNAIIQAASEPGLHRVWYGHDFFTNVDNVVAKFGWGAIPDYIIQLLKDSLTRSGLPLPGVELLVQSGAVSDRVATDWLSTNIGEVFGAGLSFLGTYKLYRAAKSGRLSKPKVIFATVGIGLKLVSGVMTAQPFLILSGLADTAILVTNLDQVKAAFKKGIQEFNKKPQAVRDLYERVAAPTAVAPVSQESSTPQDGREVKLPGSYPGDAGSTPAPATTFLPVQPVQSVEATPPTLPPEETRDVATTEATPPPLPPEPTRAPFPTDAESYQAARDERYAKLVAELDLLSAEQIRSRIDGMHKKARALGKSKKNAFDAEQLHKTANDLENHFFLILNPDQATPENIAHAQAYNFALPRTDVAQDAAPAPTIKMAQAAKTLGITPKELLRLVKAAMIPAEKRGNNYLFTQEALDAYAAERAAKQAPVLEKLAAVANNTATEADVADLRQRGLVEIYRGERVINQKGYDLMAKAGMAPRLTRNQRVQEIDDQLGPVEKDDGSDIPLNPRVTKSGRLYLVRGPQGSTPAQIPITNERQAREQANRVAEQFDAREAELEALRQEQESQQPEPEPEAMDLEPSETDAPLIPKFYNLLVGAVRDYNSLRERGEALPESGERLVTQALAIAQRLGMENLHPGTLLLRLGRLPVGPLMRSQADLIDAVHDVLQDGTRDIPPADLNLKTGIASPAGFTNRDSSPLSWGQLIQLGALRATPRPDGSLRVRMGKTPEQMKADAEQAELEAMQREYLDDLRAETGNLDKAMEDASASGFELLDAIQMAGGLPSPTSENAESHRGELTTLFESAKAMGKGAYGGKGIFVSRIFRKNAPDLDRLAQSLRGHGFDTFTPSDVLDLVDARFTENRPMYGTTTDFDDGLGERAVAAKPRVRLANASVTTEAGPIFLKKAHHGTPHKVVRFILDKIGTGEGAQAYGWGLYFAENKNVAIKYRDRLEDSSSSTIGGRPVSDAREELKAAGYVERERVLVDDDTGAPVNIMSLPLDLRQAWEHVDRLGGNLYTVELDVDDADLLDWDAPLSEQSEKVREALKKYQTDEYPFWEMDGGGFYEQLVRDAGTAADASAELLAAGIPGIRYLDQGSRGGAFKIVGGQSPFTGNPAAGFTFLTRAEAERALHEVQKTFPGAEIQEDGTYNFVIFDENLIRIVAENGEPVGNAEVVKNLMADSAAAGMLEEDGIPGALPLDAAAGLAQSGTRPGAQPAQGAAPAVAVDARQGELGIPAEDAFAGIAYRPARIWGLQALADRFLRIRNSVGGQPIQPPIFRRDFGARQAAFRKAAQAAESLYRETLANVDAAYADRPGTADPLLPRLPEVRALFTDANGEMQLLGSRPVELEAGEPLFAKPRRTAPHQLDLFSDNYNQTATPWTPSWQAKEPAKADAPALSLEQQTEGVGRIEDFGEKLEGARKDLWQRYTDMVMAELPADARDITLAKYLPEPDYEAMIASGMEPARVAAVKAIRDVIPRKPSSGYKLAIWTKMVRDLRPLIQRLIDPANPIPLDKFQLAIADSREIRDTVRFYEDLGWPHFTQAKGWKLKQSEGYIRWNGELLPKSTVVSYMEQEFRASTELSSVNSPGDWRQGYAAVLQKFRDYLDAQAAQAKEPKKIDFQIYSDTQTRDVFIGKKGVSGVIRLQTGFASAKEARNWLADHYNELALKWEGMRQEPVLRRATNEPRTGPKRREGDVTPEMFSEAFGFRGVQFGNYVEGDRRQRDLNNAFDAFMDLSEALGIPAKALSFDGSLGLAFGARGRGGKRPAAAHYEPGEVVINLTKNAGPGSLAHEWFHALDNYFARLERTGSTKPKDLDEWATRNINDPRNVRPEVMEAFRVIRNSLGGDLDRRSRALDSTRSAPYYSQTIEKAARAFETYVIDRLGKSSVSNDYLANIDPTSEAYPRPNEMDGGIRQAFDTLFTTLDTRQGERGTMLFAKPRRNQTDAEINAVRAEYKNTAAWMKAPNGNPSNLPEDQWLAARTPSFKEQSGDWEVLAKKEVIRQMEPVIADNSAFPEIADADTLRKIGEVEFLKLVAAHGSLETAVRNKFDGSRIIFTRYQFGKPKSHSADPRIMRLVPSLPALAENAVPLYKEGESNPSKYSNIQGWQTYGVKTNLNGQELIVQVSTFELTDGTRVFAQYHDHNATWLERMEKGQDAGPDPVTNRAATQTDLSKNKIYQWWNSVNPENITVPLDENGEPTAAAVESFLEPPLFAKARPMRDTTAELFGNETPFNLVGETLPPSAPARPDIVVDAQAREQAFRQSGREDVGDLFAEPAPAIPSPAMSGRRSEGAAAPSAISPASQQSLFTEPVTEQGTLFDISPVGPRTWTQAEAARTITKQKAAEILKGSNLEGRNISTYEQAVAANNAHMGTLASEWSAVPIEEVVFENGESIPKYDAAATRDYRAASTLYPGDSNYPACQWCGKQPVRQLFQIKHDGKKLTLLAGSECITHFEEASGDRMLQDAKTKKNLADITAIRDARRELRNEFFESRTDSYGRTQSVWKNYDAEQIYNKLNTGNIDTDSGAAALTRWAKTKGPSAMQAMQEFSAFMADPKTIQQRIKRREALLRSMAYQLEPQYAEKFLPDYQVESLKRQKEKLESEIAELSGSMPLFAKPARDVTRRNTAVQQAAQDYFDRKISQEEYLAIVRAEMPYMPMAEVPIPATAAEMDVISEDKKPKLFKASETLHAGDKVGLRLDIPAYRDHGVWIVSVHQPGTKSGAGTPIGYEPVARIRNATFESNPKAALNIARGTANKSTIARMEGEWVPSTPEEARQLAESAMNDPQWVQVGMNPFRHSWFYNRATGIPVVSAEDVVQVGGLVLAKNPVYTTPFDERFDAGGGVLFAKPRKPRPSSLLAETKGKVVAGTAVGTRNPTGKAAQEAGTDRSALVDLASMRRDPELYRKNAVLLADFPLVAGQVPEAAKIVRDISAPLKQAREQFLNASKRLEDARNELKAELARRQGVRPNKIKVAEVDKLEQGDTKVAEDDRVIKRHLAQIAKARKIQDAFRDKRDKKQAEFDANSKALLAGKKFPIELADRVYAALKTAAVRNLELLIELFPADLRDTARLWYDGANIIAQDFAARYNTTLNRSAAVLAVFSPQKDWFMNVALGQRMMNIWANHQNTRFDDAMAKQYLMRAGEPEPQWDKKTDDYKRDANGDLVYTKGAKPIRDEEGNITGWENWDNEKAQEKFEKAQKDLAMMRGKKLSELEPEFQARFIRMWSEVYDAPGFPVVTPAGTFGNNKLSEKGNEQRLAWGSYVTIEKAIAILTAPAASEMQVISNELGVQHKVRSFYNNIVDPANADGHVTMDTHAIAAILWQALSGNSPEVSMNFGGGGASGNSNLGISGLYPAFAEAYREVAAEFGLLPREVQSITWESVRLLFPAKFKSQKANVAKVREVWDQHEQGTITTQQAHDRIYQLVDEWKRRSTLAGQPGKTAAAAVADGSGVGRPDWAEVTRSGDNNSQAPQGAADAGGLPDRRRRGDGTGRSAVGRRGAGRDAGLLPATPKGRQSGAVLGAKPRRADWPAMLERANDISVQEFAALARDGKLNEATGEPNPMEAGTGTTPISIGAAAGYPLEDIAHFYIARQLPEKFRDRADASRLVAKTIRGAKDAAESNTILRAFDRFAADAATEAQAEPILAAKPRRTPPPLPPMEKRIEASLDAIESWNNVLRAAEEKPAGSVRKLAGEIREAMPYEIWKGYQNLFRGRLDVADALAPGVKNILQAAQQEEALAQIGVNAVVDGLRRELQKAFGDPAFWNKNRARLKEATRLLLPTASYLQPERVGVDGGFEWREFERRSGTISQVEARKLRLRDGEWFQYDGRTYRLGDFLPDEKAFVLLEPISVEMQQAIYEEFWQNFPEALPILDRWITPDLKDAYTVGLGSTMSVEFNREALLSFMNEWPQDLKDAFGDLLPEVPRVEGYTPDVAAQRSIIATIASLLGKYKSPGRRFKSGALREAGNVKNLIDGFSTRAMEAHREKIRMRMREGIIEKAVVLRESIPAEAMGNYVALEDVFSSIVKAVEAARLLDKKAYPHLSKALNPKDQIQLMKLVGDAARLNSIEQMVHKDVYRELMLSMARAQTEGILLRILNFFLRGVKLGKLTAGSVGINWIGNELQKYTQILNRTNRVFTHLLVGETRGAKVNALEAMFLLRGLITDRMPNTLNQSRIADLIPRELFENTTMLSALDAGTNYGNLIDDIKRNGILRGPAQGFINAFKQGGISASILYSVHYSGGDAAAKQQSAYAAYRARAEVAADEAGVKKNRTEWMREWINKQVRENTAVHREVMDAALLYFMDYSNVPAWMDPAASLPDEKGRRFLKEHGLWFIKWPYNFMRLIKRHSLDGLIETFSPSSTKSERARGLANMLTLAAIAYGGAALLSGDDEEDSVTGSRYDEDGNFLDRDRDTSSRLNVSAIARNLRLGRVIATALRMAGVSVNDDLTNHRGDDYWMYYRNITWLPEAVLAGRALRGDFRGFLNDAGPYISDMMATGILVRMLGLVTVGSMDAKKKTENLYAETAWEVLSSPVNPDALTRYVSYMIDPVSRRSKDSKALDFKLGPVEAVKAKIPGLTKTLPAAGLVQLPAVLTSNYNPGADYNARLKAINKNLSGAERDAAIRDLDARFQAQAAAEPIDLRQVMFQMGLDPALARNPGETTRNIAGDLARLQQMGVGAESIRITEKRLKNGSTQTYIAYPDPDTVAYRDPMFSLLKIATGVNIRPLPRRQSRPTPQPETLTPDFMFGGEEQQANLTLPRQ